MALCGLCYLAQGWIIGSSGFSSASQIPTLLGIGLILVWTVWLLVAALRMKTAALTVRRNDLVVASTEMAAAKSKRNRI
jgi:hypothetical protein